MKKQEITVNENALEPLIPVGATVVCSQEIEPEKGDYVVFFPENGVPIFRKWMPLPNGMILLKALSKNADSYKASLDELSSRGKIFVILSMNRTFREIPCRTETEQGLIASPGDFLTFSETMNILKVKRTRMYELLQSGELKASKLGRLWRIERSSLNEFIKQCRT